MKFLKFFFILIVMILFTGCIRYVGGLCKYKKIVGVAKITQIDSGCKADFYPKQEPFREWNIEKNILGLEIECQGFEKNRTYPAVYSKIIQGSCSPFRVDIYRKSFLLSSIKGSSVCLDENTMIPDIYNQKKLSKVFFNYRLLSQFYKNKKLMYAIIQPPKYSEEYAFSLSNSESKKFERLVLKKFNFFNLKKGDMENKSFQCNNDEIEIIFDYIP